MNMLDLPKIAVEYMESISRKLVNKPTLKQMFEKCYVNTLQTTTQIMMDDTTYVFTGDISAMWLRDSSAQVKHYLHLAKEDKGMQRIIEGVIKRQIMYISIDSYANAFNLEANNKGHQDDITKQNPWIWERKYEVDSLCYPIQLSYKYWKETGIESHFNDNYKKVCNIIIDQFKKEQIHFERSDYSFVRNDCRDSDTMPCLGKGNVVGYTGMTWSGFRPSDDCCKYGYFIPANMFAVVILKYIKEISETVLKDNELALRANNLSNEISEGIQKFGIYDHPKYGKIYAFETDGLGNYNLMDDANVPSLLSAPYFEYCRKDDELYKNTRAFILSVDNNYFYKGRYAKGVGSPHTPKGFIWPMSLIVQAITSDDIQEIDEILSMLVNTDASTGFIHESFNSDNPQDYTRSWFAWGNSMFSELIIKNINSIAK